MNLRKLLLAVGCASLGVAVGCGGSSKPTNTIVTSGANVAPLVVNAGPAVSVGFSYVNGAFTSVQVCVPSTSTCQTISGVLVDTGSVGLRILSSALSISLPQQNGTGGNPVDECLPFVSAYAWGPVQTADVQIASETASAVPIQVIGGTAPPVPAGCSAFGGTNVDTLSALGANGILGVGVTLQDCGQACAVTGSTNPGLYYVCASSSCTVTAEPLTAQLQNPVSLFATDNNGVIIELPAVNGTEGTVSGSLVFGIGTESNNAMGSATVYTVDDFADFTTNFNNQSYSSSFIDSGSNGLYFLDGSLTGIATCPDSADFYCPSSVENLSATNVGTNGASGSVSFSVGNADTLFNTGDAALSQLGGTSAPAGEYFDWGLPFFYGRNVFTAIETKTTPGGTGPYWAY